MRGAGGDEPGKADAVDELGHHNRFFVVFVEKYFLAFSSFLRFTLKYFRNLFPEIPDVINSAVANDVAQDHNNVNQKRIEKFLSQRLPKIRRGRLTNNRAFNDRERYQKLCIYMSAEVESFSII